MKRRAPTNQRSNESSRGKSDLFFFQSFFASLQESGYQARGSHFTRTAVSTRFLRTAPQDKEIKMIELSPKQSIAFCLVCHVAIYIGAFYYYGDHSTVDWQVHDPSKQPVTVSNIPGLIVITGAMALSVIPLIWQSFEYKRSNPRRTTFLQWCRPWLL